ncbi:MAG: toxic anion resistance protein [Eubacterium sp.]|nr:toxic anion resistance protein [Eubacterium sp.]
MADEKNMTFEEEIEATAIPAAPELKFGDVIEATDVTIEDVEETEQATEKAAEEAQVPTVSLREQELASLTEQEIKQVREFANKIDVTNTNAIMTYGVGAQKKIADFSEKALENVKTKDMGEVGEMITDLVAQLKNFDVDENEKGLKGLFHKKKNDLYAMKSKYSKVEVNVESIKNELETRQVQLMKDSAMLDKMYEMNLGYFKELTMYIAAGKQKLDEVRSNDLVALQQKAEASGLPEDAQAAKDLANQCERFEKKLYDLELTRSIAMQTGPQIRMVQASDNVMAEKIQSTIVNTIPLWKNQMVIAMGLEHSTQAAKAQREVTEMTNALLKKNADALKTATLESVKESERGIVELETLKYTNESLITTLDEVLRIQMEGKAKRVEAENQLAAIETQLKQKLLEASKQ